MSQFTPEGAELVNRLLAETREELNRADAKVAMLFAVFGVAFGAVLAGLVAGDWEPSNLAAWGEVIWWSGTVLALGGIVSLAVAVWPRLAHKHAAGAVTYFMHVTDYSDRDELRKAINGEALNDAERELEQLHALAHLAKAKYESIRWGLCLYAIGAAAAATAALAG